MASTTLFTDDEKALIVFYGYSEANELSRSALIGRLRNKKGTAAVVKKLSALSDSEYQRISLEFLNRFVSDLGFVSNN